MLSVMPMEYGGDSHPPGRGSISDEDLLELFQTNLDNDSPASDLVDFSDIADLAQSSAPLNEVETQTSAAPLYTEEHQDSLWPTSRYNQSFNRNYLNGIEDISNESSNSTDMPPTSVFHPEQNMHISNPISPFLSAAMNVDQEITNLPNIQVPALLRNDQEHSNSSHVDKGLEFPSSAVSLPPTLHQSQNTFFPNSSQSSGFSSSGNNELSRHWDPHLSGLLDEEEVFKSSMKAIDLSVSGRTDFLNHSSEIPFGKEFIGKFESEIVNVKEKISSGEIVSLVRASSMFDPYGIQVENRLGITIGSIKGKHAVVLSHILDKSLAIIKGKVSVTPRNIFSFPLTVNLWGYLDKMGQVLTYLKANDIPVESQFRMDNTQNQPTSSLFPMDYGHVLSSRTYVSPIEMENELDEMFKTLDEGDKVTEADPALAVRTPMYPHQKQALNWMMCKENKDTLPPFWNKRGDLYVNTLTKERTVKKPDSIHGGILADDMGLGKTLEMISLIVTNFVKGKPLAEPCSKVSRDPFGSVGKMSKSNSFSRIKQESDSKSSMDSLSGSPSPPRLILPSHPSKASVDIINECKSFHVLNNVAVKMEDQDSSSFGFETSQSTDLTTEVLERKPIPPLVLKRSESRRSSKRSIWCVDSDDEDIEDLSLCLGNEFKGKGLGKKSKYQELPEVTDVLAMLTSSQNCSSGELEQPVDHKDVPVEDLYVQNTVTDGPHLIINKTEYPDKKLSEKATEHGNSFEKAIDVDALPDNTITVPNNSQDVIMVSEDLQVVKPVPNDYSETKVQEAAIVISDSEDELPDIVSPLIKKKLVVKKLSQKVNAYVDKETGRTCTNSPRGTLIICPLSVISNWVDQFEEHIADNVLINLHVYYGQKRTLDVEFLKGQDVVVTTYATLMSDFKRGDSSPLHQIEWLRVVLDEGHIIRNPAAQQTKAIFKLEAERRWVLTGTPIQNSLKDLWSLINFLKVEPFTEKHFWNRIIAVPMIKHEPQAVRRVAHLVRNLAMRRTKNQQLNGKPILSLPGRHVYLEKITLSPEERSVYEAVQNRSQDIFGDFCDDGTLLNHYGTILTLLLRLRQLCCHSLLVRKTSAKNKNPDAVLDDILHSDNAISEGDKGDRQKLIAQLKAVLESGSDEECSICLESLKEPIITSCAHVYCRKCIEHVIQTNLNEARCPMCRSLVEKNELYGVPENAENGNGNQDSLEIAPDEWKSSAKVDALMKALHELRLSEPGVKSVIVSQFTALLTLLETPLEEQGFKFARLDGSMRASNRSAAVHQFSDNSPGSPTIFLLSLKAGGVGINLTAASRVFLMDPAWNPAAEDQCFDRCHRLGQTSDVIITKFVIEDSIEERMLELQDKKRQLINGVLDKKLSADQRRDIRINEIRTLLNL